MGWQDAPVVGNAPVAVPSATGQPAWMSAPIVTPSAPAHPAPPQATPEPIQDTGAVFGRPGLNVGTSEGKESLADRISGDKRREFDFPSVAGFSGAQMPTEGSGAAVVTGAAFGGDEGFLDILQKNYPGAQFSQDKFGNPIMSIEGRNFYVNRPGLDSGDILRLAPNVAAGLGVGTAAGRMVTGVLPRMLAVGTAEGGLSVGTDLAAQAAGSEQPIDMNKALLSAGLGFTGEGVGAGLSTIIRSLGQRAAQIVPGVSGQTTLQLAPELIAALRKAGFDPSQVTAEWLQRFQAQAQKSLSAEEAARFTDLQTLPTPVPATRGDITRLPQDQMFEDQAFKGSFGQRPAAVIQGMRGRQEDALLSNVEQVQGRMSGTGVPAVVEPGQGGALASDAIVGMRDAAKRGVDDAYEFAREGGGQAGIPRENVAGMSHSVQGAAADFVGFTPKAEALGVELRGLSAAGGDADVTVRSLFDWRRRASALRGTTTDPAEATAIGRMVRQFDDEMKDAIERELVRGDTEAVGRWLDANKMRAEFGRLFEGDDLVQRITSREPRSGQMQLVVPPGEVANEIFGRSGLKLGDKNLGRDLIRLRSILGADSEAWNSLREEAFLRLFRSTEGGYVGKTTERAVSGAKLATALDNALERSGPLMRILFKPDEIAQMQQLKRAALAVTTTNKGGQNFSNTASAGASIMQNTLGKLVAAIGGKAGLILQNTPLLKATYNIGQGIKAGARAPLGGTATPRPLPYSGAGLGGGTLSQLGLPYFNP